MNQVIIRFFTWLTIDEAVYGTRESVSEASALYQKELGMTIGRSYNKWWTIIDDCTNYFMFRTDNDKFGSKAKMKILDEAKKLSEYDKHESRILYECWP